MKEGRTVRERIASHHARLYEEAGFPAQITAAQLEAREVRVAGEGESAVAYVADPPFDIPELRYPVLSLLTPLGRTPDAAALRAAIAGRHLVLHETCNQEVVGLLDALPLRETYYDQARMLCRDLDSRPVPLPEGVTVRNFQPGRDEEAYAAFYNEVLGFLGTIVNRGFVDKIVAGPSFDAAGYFLAEAQDRLAGFLAIEKEPWGGKGSGFGYVYQVGVSEAWRSSGLAHALMAMGKEFARSRGVDRLGVGVRATNTAAVKYFQGHGFVTAWRVKGLLFDPGEGGGS